MEKKTQTNSCYLNLSFVYLSLTQTGENTFFFNSNPHFYDAVVFCVKKIE